VRELLGPEAAEAPLPQGPRPGGRERRAGTKPGKTGGGRARADIPKPAGAKPRLPAKSVLRTFLESLDDTDRAALALVAGAPEKDLDAARSLAALARAGDTMPELVIDRINAGFLEISGDLLVDTVDEAPSIQPEYKEEIKKLLGGL
jgi:hypothetical protein